MNGKFIGRHHSLLAALLAHGVLPPEADALIAHARSAGSDQIVAVVRGGVLGFWRRRGGHADVFSLRKLSDG